jgi:Ca-activated chloride channel family protein
VFIDYLLEPQQQRAAEEWGFRPADTAQAGGPYLTAEYGIDPAQPKKLLGAVDPAIAEAILADWQDVKKPGVVVLVLDTSGSMQGEKIEQAKQGALGFLDTISVQNHVGLVTFSARVNRTVSIGPVQQNRFDLADVVEASQANGGTALYDAVKAAVTMADTYQPNLEAIRGVIVLSDGANTEGMTKLSDLFELRTANEQRLTNYNSNPDENIHASALAFPTTHPVHVFSIAYGKDADLDVLRIFSEGTNSTFNSANEQNITQVLEVFGKYF